VLADAEEPADLQHGEQHALLIDDDVVERSDVFVLVVGDACADQLRPAMALRH